MTAVVAESADNLGKYGLTAPAITFTATDENGKSATLIVGKKEGNDYFAKDASRPTIFRVNESLYKKLAENLQRLARQKAGSPDAERSHARRAAQCERHRRHHAKIRTGMDRRSAAGIERESGGDLEDIHSGRRALAPLAIVDHPSAEISGQTRQATRSNDADDQGRKENDGELHAVIGDFVYARTSDAPTVYKLKKNVLDDLNSKTIGVRDTSVRLRAENS